MALYDPAISKALTHLTKLAAALWGAHGVNAGTNFLVD